MSRTTPRRGISRAVVVAAAGLLALSACGSGSPSGRTPVPTGPTTSMSPSAATSSPAQPTAPSGSSTHPAPTERTFSVYFFSKLSKDRLAPVVRPAGSQTVLADALRALSVGPNQSEQVVGITTQFPRDVEVHDIDLHDGVATIELDGDHAAEHAELPDAALAQVVFTATQFPTVHAVKVEGDGHHQVLTRNDFENWSPQVLVEAPVMGATIHSPVRIVGTANTYEAHLRIEITDWDGRIVASQAVMATSGSGTRGTFDVTIPYTTARSGSGEIVTSVQSAKDGSRIVISEIPVTVAP